MAKDSQPNRVVGLRGLDHRGERYIHLDDLVLVAQRYADEWRGRDAHLAIGTLIASLSEWSITTPGAAD